MSTEPPSKREFTRVPVHCHASIRNDAGPVPCEFISTLSMNGMFAKTTAPLTVGTECLITIALVEHEIEIELLGTVVHCHPDGLAFQFIKIFGPESYEHLRNLVLYNADNTDAVENEFNTHAGIKRRDPESR